MSKVIVITGSTKGIGYGIAEEFLKAGCKVVLSGRNAEALAQAAGQLAARYGNESVAGFLCDVTVSEQVQGLWDSATAKFGRVDIWINNAGAAHTVTNLWELDEKVIQMIIDSNIIALLNGCRVAIKGMLAQTLPAGFMEVGETTRVGALRETLEEARARVALGPLFTMIDVPYIEQVHVFFRAELLDLDFAPGDESLEVKLFTEPEIPWPELALRTVAQTLRLFFDDRARGAFGTHVHTIDAPASQQAGGS